MTRLELRDLPRARAHFRQRQNQAAARPRRSGIESPTGTIHPRLTLAPIAGRG